jgi:hypothetical protein
MLRTARRGAWQGQSPADKEWKRKQTHFPFTTAMIDIRCRQKKHLSPSRFSSLAPPGPPGSFGIREAEKQWPVTKYPVSIVDKKV